MSSTYQDFLLSNATRITSIESTLRSLTWFLPGRFKDAELASESPLNLLSLYHDRIITQVAASLPSSQRPTQTSHARYTTAWCAVSSMYNFLAHALAIISHSQLLIEMVARRRLGSKRRWRVVLMLELIKALLRLKLVDLTSRMLVNPSLPERSVDPATLEAHQSRNASTTTSTANDPWSTQSSYSNNLLTSPSPTPSPPPNPLGSPQNDQLIALTLEEVLKPLDLVRKSRTNKDKLAEIIWILRPVIYVLTINRFGHRHTIHSSAPYPSKSILFTKDSVQSFVSELERNELDSRRLAFWSYFLRGPLWSLWTKPKLLQISKKFESVPIFNLISTAILDYTPLLDEYHYYVS
ncbi:hypothetical protein H4Q26_014094 [Puccinia striiformis f. sp. tritici PST-130]|nr:hypothetical protein H4Q26_014094 [Puccinia striiformis f. sp. tritici PST-130]